jgi:hypothetical protein
LIEHDPGISGDTLTTGHCGDDKPRVIRVVTMPRVTALLCAAVLMMQALAARTVLEQSVTQSACADDGADCGCSPTSDEALAARHVVIAQPAAPRQSRWDGPEPSVVASPAPDEILHVPKPVLA